jgi:hypothetical protein
VVERVADDGAATLLDDALIGAAEARGGEG